MRILTETPVPAQSYEEALRQAADVWGVQREYWDIFGRHHIAPPDVLRAVLTSMDVSTETIDSLNAAIDERAWQGWSRIVAPALVLRLARGVVPLQIAAEREDAQIEAAFEWEDGSIERVVAPVSTLRAEGAATVRGRSFIRRLLPLPAGARLGYHTLKVRIPDEPESEGRLILCPDHAWKPEVMREGGKAAGVAISLYGLRSHRNWGCGDFTDLLGLTDWVAHDMGASFVALNPLHSIPNRQPYNTSPYLPNCSFYRNALYLDVERVDGIANSILAQKLLGGENVLGSLAELRGSAHVEYEKVWDIKRRFLKMAFRAFMRENDAPAARVTDFHRYVESEGELLHHFALYCALDEIIHKQNPDTWIWPDWLPCYKDLSSPEIAAFTDDHRRLILFYKWVQWQVDLQLAEAQKHAKECGLAIGLYHDLALATDRCGSDLWAHGPFYVSGCRVGSPPDAFAPDGQDWAFPPPNSLRHYTDGYRMFAESIRKNSAHGGALRIDHVMRFFRLFWIPDGKRASEGVYVREFAEDVLGILALESVRNQTVVIGEDLGTVEPYIREMLHDYGILSYRLLFFERKEDGSFKKPDEYPRQALVSVSTHDLPTLAGFWSGRDLRARLHAGVLDQRSYEEQLRGRAEDKQRMLDVFLAAGLLPSTFPRQVNDIPEFTGELHNAAIGFLASTPSELMVLNQEDLFKDTEQQNLPGTTTEYPNWRHKMIYSVEQLRTDPHARDCTHMFRSWLERTGRLNQAGRV